VAQRAEVQDVQVVGNGNKWASAARTSLAFSRISPSSLYFTASFSLLTTTLNGKLTQVAAATT
jgi:hypothetical protein